MELNEGLKGLTPRQDALLKLIQSLPADRSLRMTITCRGQDPWEVELELESERGELKPRSA